MFRHTAVYPQWFLVTSIAVSNEECIPVNAFYKPTVRSVPLFLTQIPGLLHFKKWLLLHETNEKQRSKRGLEIVT